MLFEDSEVMNIYHQAYLKYLSIKTYADAEKLKQSRQINKSIFFMTKLKLNLAQGAGEILTREELKKVLGGNGYYCTRSKGTETVSNFFTNT